jgi:hypothetical protein
METQSTFKNPVDRTGERGAALVMTLLIALLLLAAGGALIATTAMSASTTNDSTAEMQAYYIAESGMQSALNVIRGNTKPLVTSTDRMSFRTAIIPDISNGPGNTGAVRLAGWLSYNDRTDPSSLVPVSIGSITGGYRVTVQNLDPNSHIVQFQTSGWINGSNVATPNQRTFGTVGGTDEVTVRYNGQAATTLSPNPYVYPLTLDSQLGSFVIERPVTSTQNGVVIPKTDFELTVTQTLPWAASTVFEASIEGTVDVSATTLKVTFKKATMKAEGTTYALNFGGGSKVLNLNFTASPGTTAIPARVTSPDPKRLLLRSYGFGPHGSEKRLEMLLSRVNLDFEAPAGVTLQGADDCTAPTFDSGSSGSKWYSGIDYSGVEAQRPSFAVTGCDAGDIAAGIVKHDTVVDPEIGVLSSDSSVAGTVERPNFLDTPDKARAYLNSLQAQAESINRYFKPTSGSAVTVDDAVDSSAFTFVDGDCTLLGGSGFLVVTGTLTMRGNTNFRGVILVMGTGVLVRNGGGNGEILGGITIARFDRSAGGFLAPTFTTSGGGNSNVQYDSQSLNQALRSGSNVSGIREF